jgi:nitrogenase molybdenum-iron protein alpha/beta subunit
MKQNIIDVEIDPAAPALSRLGASRADFAAALDAALDSLAGKSPSELPRPSEIPINIRGQQQRLGEVAVIRVRLRDDTQTLGVRPRAL